TFDEKYVKNSGNDDFKAAYKKASCNVCHVKGKKKDWVNAYGLELAELIPGNAKQRLADAKKKGTEERAAENEKLVKELLAAFGKVAEKKSPGGKTYAEMFKSHELPTPDGAKSTK
ncbi:MAG: hypothetical protein QGG36_29405, partial [Pirellulaceae bacterium]|nr:hypothetical protein [Pirellulaceae bacterium]